MDCDGVLTDGRLWLMADSDEQKTFHARDGQGISLCHHAGLKTGIISGRTSSAVERRAQAFKMSDVPQYAQNKGKTLDENPAAGRATADEGADNGDAAADVT